MADLLDTADRIKTKAHALFMQYGLRSVSMDDIAKELGVSKKTIYLHYEDKDALVEDVMTTVFENDKVCCNAYIEKSANAIHEIFLSIDFIVDMFKEMNPSVLFDLQKYHPKSFERFVLHKDNYLYSLVLSNIKKGIEEELYRADLNAEIMARLRVESLMLPLTPNFQNKLKTSLVKLEEEITMHFVFGLVTAKGYKLIIKYQEQKNKINEASRK